jgi:hypothetical protein
MAVGWVELIFSSPWLLALGLFTSSPFFELEEQRRKKETRSANLSISQPY